MIELRTLPLNEITGTDLIADAQRIRESVINCIEPEFIPTTLCSGFDGSNSVIGNEYQPHGEYVEEGLIDAMTAQEWCTQRFGGLLDVAYYALMHSQPAVGLYEPEAFDQVGKHSYQVKPGITVPEACLAVFIWR